VLQKKSIQGFPHVFGNPLLQIANPSASPILTGATVSISVANSFDLPKKKGAMMQKANVNHGKRKDRQDGVKERVAVGSLFEVVVYLVSRSWYDAKVDGEKK
jgi:hypothetical protein